jgi:membrane protein implicated in regulation of membrane protease activity
MQGLFKGRSRVNGSIAGVDDACLGQHAIVSERIAPLVEGKVELNGVSWSATAEETLEVGVPVKVVDRQGLTLTVCRRS